MMPLRLKSVVAKLEAFAVPEGLSVVAPVSGRILQFRQAPAPLSVAQKPSLGLARLFDGGGPRTFLKEAPLQMDAAFTGKATNGELSAREIELGFQTVLVQRQRVFDQVAEIKELIQKYEAMFPEIFSIVSGVTSDLRKLSTKDIGLFVAGLLKQSAEEVILDDSGRAKFESAKERLSLAKDVLGRKKSDFAESRAIDELLDVIQTAEEQINAILRQGQLVKNILSELKNNLDVVTKKIPPVFAQVEKMVNWEDVGSLQQTTKALFSNTDDLFSEALLFEGELMSWVILNAIRIGEQDMAAKLAVLAEIKAYWEEIMEFDKIIFANNWQQLKKSNALHQRRLYLYDHMNFVDPSERGFPLFERTSGCIDASYLNSGCPPRIFHGRLGTALTWTPHNMAGNPSDSIVSESDLGLVIFLHGTSAIYSNSNAMMGAMDAVTRTDRHGAKKKLFAGMAIDWPEHGFGPRDRSLDHPSAFWDWLRGVVEYACAQGKPTFLFSRSFGADAALDYSLRVRDHGLAGVIAMSGYPKRWVPYTMDSLRGKGVEINEAGDRWSQCIDETWLFDEEAYAGAHDLPVLIMYGRKDFEYPPEQLARYWKDRYGGRPGYTVAEFPTGGHDLFDPHNPDVFKAARETVHDFLDVAIQRFQRHQ